MTTCRANTLGYSPLITSTTCLGPQMQDWGPGATPPGFAGPRMLCWPFPSQQPPCCMLLGLVLCRLHAGRAPSAHTPRIPPKFPSRHGCGLAARGGCCREPIPLPLHPNSYLSPQPCNGVPVNTGAKLPLGSNPFPPAGLRSCGGVGADPAGSGDVGRVRLGGAALRPHGAGPQPLHHRAERLQGGRLPLLRQLGGSPAVRPLSVGTGHPRGAKAPIWGPISVAPLFFCFS